MSTQAAAQAPRVSASCESSVYPMTADVSTVAVPDPVCGTPVDALSVFQGSFRGAWFMFCSMECRERFLTDPARYLVGDPASSDAQSSRHWLSDDQVPEREASSSNVVFLDSARDTVLPDDAITADSGPPTLPTLEGWSAGNAAVATEEAAASAPAQVSFPAAAPGRHDGARGRIFSFLVPMQQRKFARQVSRELLALGRSLHDCPGGLQGYDLYRAVVRERLKIDAAGADALLELADQSFAAWPTTRALNFADVVHMVVLTEFRARFGARPWIEANLGAVVARQIPREL